MVTYRARKDWRGFADRHGIHEKGYAPCAQSKQTIAKRELILDSRTLPVEGYNASMWHQDTVWSIWRFCTTWTPKPCQAVCTKLWWMCGVLPNMPLSLLWWAQPGCLTWPFNNTVGKNTSIVGIANFCKVWFDIIAKYNRYYYKCDSTHQQVSKRSHAWSQVDRYRCPASLQCANYGQHRHYRENNMP